MLKNRVGPFTGRLCLLLSLLSLGVVPGWCSIAVDANTSKDQGSASKTITTPAFSTTAGNELLLAFISTDYRSGANVTVTAVSGGSLTWTLVVRTNIQSGTAEIWRAFANTTLSGVSVKAALSQSVSSSITVMSFTGVDTSGVNGTGAVGATGSGNARSGAPTATLTTTRNNSWVFAVGNDYDYAIARTPDSGQVLVHQDLAPVGDTYWVQMQSSPTAQSGTPVVMGDTAPTSDRYNLSLIEVLPPSGGPSWSISGTISPVSGGAGATVTLSGAATATINADASGNYSFGGLSNGAYTVTPSKTGYAFSPSSQAVTVSDANVSGINFSSQAASAGIQLVQKNVNGNEATTKNMSVGFPLNNVQGDFLIVTGSAARPASTISIADTAGNTYNLAAGPISDPAQDVNVYIWYVPNCKAGPNTVTLTPSTPGALEIHVSEWSGLSQVSPLDQVSYATGNGANLSSGAASTSVNGELIFGYSWQLNNASAGPGFTPLSIVNGDLDEYEIQGVAGSVAATFTQASGQWLAIMATFEPAPQTPPGFNLSGVISPVDGGAGAKVALTGPVNASAIADSSGNYSFAGLTDGNYTVTPSNSGYTFTPSNQSVTISDADVTGINFTASALLPVLSVAPAAIAFTANQGGSNPTPYSVSVSNNGGGTLTFTAASDSPWLAVTPANGTAPQQLQVSVDASTLAVGTYTGNVTITSPGIQGSPFTVRVTLTVGVATDWLMVDHDPGRSGYAADETTISPSNVANLQLSWTAAVDGAITAQPLFVHAITIGSQVRDVLIVATGGNSLYAFDANDGTLLWNRNFGPPTPNTWGLPDGFGIEGPPVIDRTAGRIYTVSTDGNFRTISLFDGTDVYAPLALIENPVTNKVWGGLNKLGNSVYVATGSDGGDVKPWRGQAYQVDVSGTPVLTGNFVVVPGIPAPDGGGGIWGYGGVSADLATGNIFATSAWDSNQTTLPYSDSMLALDSGLHLLGSYAPQQPPNFPCGGAPCDLDFASTPVVFQPAGCPSMTAAGNKDGNLYSFWTSDLIASGAPLQILALNTANDSLGSGGIGGVAAFSPVDNMLFVTDAGSGVSGISAGVVGLKVTNTCMLQVAWSVPLGGNDMPNSTPTVANGVVFVGEGQTGIIHAYNTQTGVELWHSGNGYKAASTYASPIVAGGKLYAGSWSTYSGGGIVGAFTLVAPNPILAVSPQSLSFNATAGGVNPDPAAFNVTNSGTGTLNFTAGSDSAWLTVTPSGGVAPQSVQVSVSIAGLTTGTYTGHITITAAGAQSSPAIVTVTLTIAPSSGGRTLAIDANVSADTIPSATVRTGAFSTISANELLLAFIASDDVSGTNAKVNSVTAAGLTWALVLRTNTQKGTAEIWRAFAPAPLTGITVTATLSQKVASSITVLSFTGVDPSGTNGSGAIGAVKSASASKGAPSATLVTTRNDSWIVGVGNDFDNAIARTPGAGQILVHQDLASVGDTYWVQMQNAPTPSSGTAVTINDTAPTADRFNLSICEVLAQP